MGKHYLIFLLSFLTHLSFGQVKFTYDAAGNRISRVNQGPVQGCEFKVQIIGEPTANCGSSFTLTASCSGGDCTGVTYAWSGPNGFSATGNTASFQAPTIEGNYTYTVKASKGSCPPVSIPHNLTISCGPLGGDGCKFSHGDLLGVVDGKSIYVSHKNLWDCQRIAFSPEGAPQSLDWLSALINRGEWNPHLPKTELWEVGECFCGSTCGSASAPTIAASSTSISSGQSSTLTATGCSGTVTWSDGQTGGSIVVSPTVTTSYTAFCTAGDCISVPSSPLSITVVPPASNRLIVGVSDITGQPSTNKRVTISNPYSGTRTYLWYIYRHADESYVGYGTDKTSSNGIFEVNLSSYNLTPGTQYRLYVGDTADPGNTRHGMGLFTISNPSTTFTVQASGGGSKACGSSANLSVSCTSGDCSGATYSWSGPNGYSSTQQNPVLTSLSSTSAGTYTATVTKNGVSVSSSITLTVTGCGACNYTNNQLLGTVDGKSIYVKVVGNCKYISFAPGDEARALDWLYAINNRGNWASGVTPLADSQITTCFKQPSEGCATSGARQAALTTRYELGEAAGTLLLIPNPAETTVELRLPASKELKQVWLLDMQGRSLRQATESTLDVRELTVGSYLIRVQTQSGETYQQLLIKK